MFLPFVGFVASATFYGIVGAILLGLLRVRAHRSWALAAFVVAAQGGSLMFAVAYAFFAGNGGHLTTTASVLGFLAGIPVAGVAAGLAAAWAAVRLRTRAASR